MRAKRPAPDLAMCRWSAFRRAMSVEAGRVMKGSYLTTVGGRCTENELSGYRVQPHTRRAEAWLAVASNAGELSHHRTVP